MSGATLAIVTMLAACFAAAGAALDLVGVLTHRLRAARTDARSARPASMQPRARWARDRTGDPATEALLDAAGRANGVDSVAALQTREDVASLLTAAWCGAVVLLVAGPVAAAAAVPLGGLSGRRLPRLLLRRTARARGVQLREETPEVIALLAAGASCGLPLAPLCRTAGDWLGGEMAAALGRAASDLQRGAAPEIVLDRFEREHPVEEVAALVAIIRRGRTHGVAAAPALGALADAARAGRARRAGDRAAKAAPRIQLVAALLLVPAALCILAAALVASGGVG
jgi:tight adherence protein C